MRRTVVGAVAVIAAASVFTLGGLGMASAATMLPSAASAGFSPVSEATALRTIHDTLESQWNAKDVGGMQASQSALATELAKLQSPQGHAGLAAMSPKAAGEVSQAVRQNDRFGQALAALRAGNGKSANDLPVPVPGVSGLTTLIQSLLATVLSIITGLLGGLPVPPVPVPVPTGGPAAPPVG
jgi:hypothetical protein